MTYTPDELLKLIHDTGALSIWDRKKGPVFWYIAGVPGPFYINTELLLGAALAKELLKGIDNILANTPADDPAPRVSQLNGLILGAVKNSPVYQQIVTTMVDRAKKEFKAGSYSFISGGERRDWLFSIPFAKECGLKHVFLFKNKTIYCEQPLQPQEAGLHIADLINNAVSYTDVWLPVLDKAGLKCGGTVCIISRGTDGVKKLEANGIKVIALNNIDLGFFERSQANGLIAAETLVEIACHFASPKEWARKYVMGNADVYNVNIIDAKSFERLKSFFANDPWELRPKFGSFFAAMQKKIAAR